MLNQLQKLRWNIRDDAVIHADPAGLVKSYYIYPPKSENNNMDTYVLELIEDSGFWDKADTTMYSSLEDAKSMAQLHYESIFAALTVTH